MMTLNLFADFDFNLLSSPDFKEDSVRETIILPILHELGYTAGGLNQIVRSRTLIHPFVNIGSKKRKIRLIPDYLLAVEGKPVWVLDAKAPGESITEGEHVEQAYSYAIHPDVRVQFYTLCNGREFIMFQIDRPQPVLYFHLSELQHHWQTLYDWLTPQGFKTSSSPVKHQYAKEKRDFDYATIKPLPEIKDLKKQSAKRHYGVHPYFTKQVWNVVQEYIKNFSKPGDTVLDPFGGSGITAVEALILGRKAIHVDLNPLSIFMVENLLAPVDVVRLGEITADIRIQFTQLPLETEEQIETALSLYNYPTGIKLPKNSDVEWIEQLFNPRQLAELAYLKHLIQQVKDDALRGTLMLMFSGLLNKINLTYHASKGRSAGRGNSSIFAYYRYRIAKKPAFLEIMNYFDSRLKKVIAAKKELAKHGVNYQALQNIQIYKGTATALELADQTVDYIYTDPPYGSKIQYLDLSVMWNAWLDLEVTSDDYELEAIEGGDLNKTQDNYADLLGQSITEMYRVLKFDRWMSFVFAHKDPSYWHLIIETAEKVGFEYMGAVKQSNNKTTFKKRQNPFTVLSGQLIINFRKSRNPKAIMRVDLGDDIAAVVMETIESVIARNEGATLEEINDELIIKGLELGFLDVLSKRYADLTPLLKEHFSYDKELQKFQISQKHSFKSRIDIRLRIQYFLVSYLRRMGRQNEFPTFDEIILHIMPLLRNGITPEEQTILSVLERIGVRMENGRWKLKGGQQLDFLQLS